MFHVTARYRNCRFIIIIITGIIIIIFLNPRKTRVRKKFRNIKCWKDYCSGRSSNTKPSCNKTELNRNSKLLLLLFLLLLLLIMMLTMTIMMREVWRNHLHLTHADPQITLIELIRYVPAKRTKLAPFLY